MENKTESYFDETFDMLKHYTEDRLLLLKIQTAKQTAKVTSKIVYIFITAILLFFAIMFVGFMLAYYFSEKLNSNFYGFSIVAGIYVCLMLLFIVLYKAYFSEKIKDTITAVFFENENYDADENEDEL